MCFRRGTSWEREVPLWPDLRGVPSLRAEGNAAVFHVPSFLSYGFPSTGVLLPVSTNEKKKFRVRQPRDKGSKYKGRVVTVVHGKGVFIFPVGPWKEKYKNDALCSG